ncbi:MAG: hypothetical protein GC168_11695 [Candidatus Hydrogenedens sp.]|nr:hypothetical protein [Candidatus Hydrogenedens sp.]
MQRSSLAIAALVLAASAFATAQEPLAPILERGYVAHWLVCGPFPPDVPGGVLGSVGSGTPPLGDRDWMAGLGGIAALRPKHKQVVSVEGGPDALWQQAGTADERLDLSPFFPEAKEGVAFAGFYADSDVPQQVYIEVQSPLGARVWFNGRGIQDVPGGALESRGVQRMVVPFRAGQNWWVAEVPGGTIDALADAAGETARALTAQTFANRTRLRGESGYEIAVSTLPAEELGDLYVIPRPQHAGTFSGTRGDVRQDERLTFFNPGDAASPPVDVLVKSKDLVEPFVVRVPAVPPGATADALLPLPARALAGTTASVTVDLIYGDVTNSLTLAYLLRPVPDSGTTFVLTGTRFDVPRGSVTQAAESRIAAVTAQLDLYQRESAYGFDLGTADLWLPAITAEPGLIPALRRGMVLERLGASGNFLPLDERVAGPELISRNIGMGMSATKARLAAGALHYDAWSQPAIAPQTFALASQAGLSGVVSKLQQTGIPAFADAAGFAGTTLPLRHLKPFAPAGTVDALRNSLLAQRRELQDQGYTANLAVLENLGVPPEAFMEAGAPRLAAEQPRFEITGNAANQFFAGAADDRLKAGVDVPLLTVPLLRARPGDVAANPAWKQAHAEMQSRLIAVEALVTFAGIEGAAYPAGRLEAAWRSVLRLAMPGAMEPEDGEARWSWLADAQWTAETIDTLLSEAAGALAAMTDTSAAGVDHAIVVFNPSDAERDERCDIVLGVARGESVAVFDDAGAPVPVEMVESAANAGPALTPYSARVRFRAQVPAWGMRVYAARASNAEAPAVTRDSEPYIENDAWQVWCDPKTGDIARYLHKPTGREFGAKGANEVLLLETDSSKSSAELWTTGKRFDLASPQFEAVRSPVRQTLTITQSAAGGTVVRTLTLASDGAVQCTLRAEGLDPKAWLLGIGLPGEGHRGVRFGERFGAVSGRPGRQQHTYQTDGLDRPGGDGLYPAWQWAARIPAASLRFGLNKEQAFLPCAIVAESEAEEPARALQTALWNRGVPSAPWPLAARKADVPWTDATLLSRLDDDLDHDTGMRVLAGEPASHRMLAELAARLTPDSQVRFGAALDAGGLFLVYDNASPGPPLPVLLAAGRDAGIAARVLESLAEAVAQTGEVTLPESALLQLADAETPGLSRPEQGDLAVLFEGAHLSGLEPDGSLTVVLGAGQSAEATPAYKYALMPLQDGAGEAEIAAAAARINRPLVVVETPPGSGRLKSGGQWLQASNPGWITTGIKAAGWGATQGSMADPHPRNGMVVRGYAPGGKPWSGTMNLGVPVLAAYASGPGEEPGAPLTSTGMSFDPGAVPPHAPRSWWVLPKAADVVPAVGSQSLEWVENEYWQHGLRMPRAAKPLAAVDVEADWKQGSAEITVGNLASDAALEGTLRIDMSKGWSYGPDQAPVKLGPGESQTYGVRFTPPSQGARGGVFATLESGSMRWLASDSNDDWVTAEIAQADGKVKVTITNPTGLTVRGVVSLVPPAGSSEVWQRWRNSGLYTGAAASLERTLELPPQAHIDFEFPLEPGLEAAVKVACNGQYRYLPVR